ncbi:GNAT family N-acetyltransferase [Mesorhizobium xinjiangense]|uniref:GNAT family N-acetyltransferase n=1 Tax=Mesorhizobium xinjiangense TaxID=2678685 RepID=UPI001F1903E7|nr:GNAT family N-acetyltransferase [Mesorhizobium xinjiangense]
MTSAPMRQDRKNGAGRISFAPVTREHFDLIRLWLNRPHIRQWWGDPETELGYIREMVEGRDTTRPFLIKLNEEPVGYIQYWFVADNQAEDQVKQNPWLRQLPAQAVGVDLSLGEEHILSQAIGSTALRQFVATLLEMGHDTIIIDPDPNNRRAVRAYEKAGFRPIANLEGCSNDALIMQYDTNNE